MHVSRHSTPRVPRSPAALPSGAGKLLVLIVGAGAVAASLLVMRQQRVETAHELTTLHRHLTMNERSLWELRAGIAERCRPEAVRRMLDELPTGWSAIPRRRPVVPPIAPVPPGAAAGASAAPPPTTEIEPGG